MDTFSIGFDFFAGLFLLIYLTKLLIQDFRLGGGSDIPYGWSRLIGDLTIEKRSLLNQHVRRRHI